MDKEKRDTFELLYKTHYKELYIHALSFVRDEEEAKDIVTDVYEYVWKNFEKLDRCRPVAFGRYYSQSGYRSLRSVADKNAVLTSRIRIVPIWSN